MRRGQRLLGSLAMFAWCAGIAGAAGWSTLPPLLEPRQEVAGAWLDDAAVVVGGFGSDRRALGSVEVWRAGMAGWDSLPPLPVAVHHAAAAVVDGALIVVGGFTAEAALRGATDAVQLYDPVAGAWRLGAPMPRARGGLAAAAWDGRLIAVGGADDRGDALGDVDAYDPVLDAWTRLTPLPTARDHLALAVVDGRLHVVGGRAGGAFTLDAHEVLDLADGGWSAAAPMPTARSGHAAAAIGDCLIAIGGEGNDARRDGLFDEVEVYDPGRDAWFSLDPMPRPRHGMVAIAAGDRVLVVGGAVVAGFAAVGVVDALDGLPRCGR